MSGERRDPNQAKGADATFSLRQGVRMEVFADGSGLLYRREPEKSVTLNVTGALLCSYADGAHSIATVLDELRDLSSELPLEEAEVIAFLDVLEQEGFLRWD